MPHIAFIAITVPKSQASILTDATSPSAMLKQLRAMQEYHNDEPTLEDNFEWREFVKKIGETIARSEPPVMLGLHGDWGSGKTSVLRQLQYYLSGSTPYPSEKCPPPRAGSDQFVTVWFDAWRYQQEASPIVALLQEIRSQLPFAANALESLQKYAEVGTRSALDILGLCIGRVKISSVIQEHGEDWEARRHQTALASDSVREAIEQSIAEIIGKKKLVIFIDDLDRCQPEVAYRLLEGVKIYLNLKNCIVVFGMNQRAVERALEISLERKGVADKNNPASYEAQEYITKICQNTIHIPPACLRKGLNRWINSNTVGRSNKRPIIDAIIRHNCLAANPRKMKAFANALHSHADRLKRRLKLVKDTEHSVVAESEATPVKMKLSNKEQAIESFLLMLLLYIDYQPMFRRLLTDISFYDDQMRPWCEGRLTPRSPESKEHGEDLFCDLLPTHWLNQPGSPDQDQLKTLYPDPAYGPYFRLQHLVKNTTLTDSDIEIWSRP